MRLVSCQIENFGKLSNTKIDFDKRIHVINQDNAWGKSTLATFIKVMLFGFANEGKRSEVGNERKKYGLYVKRRRSRSYICDSTPS